MLKNNIIRWWKVIVIEKNYFIIEWSFVILKFDIDPIKGNIEKEGYNRWNIKSNYEVEFN